MTDRRDTHKKEVEAFAQNLPIPSDSLGMAVTLRRLQEGQPKLTPGVVQRHGQVERDGDGRLPRATVRRVRRFAPNRRRRPQTRRGRVRLIGDPYRTTARSLTQVRRPPPVRGVGRDEYGINRLCATHTWASACETENTSTWVDRHEIAPITKNKRKCGGCQERSPRASGAFLFEPNSLSVRAAHCCG